MYTCLESFDLLVMRDRWTFKQRRGGRAGVWLKIVS
jgi:hypothetical protein